MAHRNEPLMISFYQLYIISLVLTITSQFLDSSLNFSVILSFQIPNIRVLAVSVAQYYGLPLTYAQIPEGTIARLRRRHWQRDFDFIFCHYLMMFLLA